MECFFFFWLIRRSPRKCC